VHATSVIGGKFGKGDALFEALSSSNVPMYVHTVNSADSMKEFFDLGITAIYTDVVDPALRY
jgi:glycerophosphoryl diester phosphodiesterase